ncbi:B-box-type zinc finger [Sesbania bispinosa]|nr:B-box-type zinc finger [Sesbania bispinosa]
MDKVCEPKWLEDFMRKTYFDTCTTHRLHRNELSQYCINCNLAVCKHCSSPETHHQHQILKIYRYSSKEVVPLDAIQKHIDCSQIQVEAVLRKPDDSAAPFISLQGLCQIKREETTEPPKRRNKRKGTPYRAPLF